MTTKGQEPRKKSDYTPRILQESAIDRMIKSSGYRNIEEARRDQRILAVRQELSTVVGKSQEEVLELLKNDDPATVALYEPIATRFGLLEE